MFYFFWILKKQVGEEKTSWSPQSRFGGSNVCSETISRALWLPWFVKISGMLASPRNATVMENRRPDLPRFCGETHFTPKMIGFNIIFIHVQAKTAKW